MAEGWCETHPVPCAMVARDVQAPSVIADAKHILRTPSARPAAQRSVFTRLDSRPPASGWDFMGVEHRPEVSCKISVKKKEKKEKRMNSGKLSAFQMTVLSIVVKNVFL